MSEIDRRDSPRLTIRRGMDVYDVDQTEYIGSVIDVIAGEASANDRAANSPSGGSSNSGHVFGEELGPFPTIGAGNTGPDSQSKARSYGTRHGGSVEHVTGVVVRPGRRNPLAHPLYIPLDAVRSIAMDRLILDVRKSDMPSEWRSPNALEHR